MGLSNKENELLKNLAIAMIENPRGTIKELAEASGISKATLHRFCGTRENLEVMINKKAVEAIDNILAIVNSEYTDYTQGLIEIIRQQFDNKEFLRFSYGTTCDEEMEICSNFYSAMDNFFLRGQTQGFFRIDLSAAFLTELFNAGICGLIDAERRGRVAKIGLVDMYSDVILKGIQRQ